MALQSENPVRQERAGVYANQRGRQRLLNEMKTL